MGKALTGLTAITGIKRRDDLAGYGAAWREANREKNNAYHRDYYHNVTKKNPDKLAAKLRSGTFTRRKIKYGISRHDYRALLTSQGGKCMICQDLVGGDLRVDHDHTTGKVRSLLCANCNSALGLFQEDTTRLSRAIEYLHLHGK